MAVVVFDTDVLIAYRDAQDVHHADAVTRVRRSLEPGNRRLMSAVNYSELLVGPRKAGPKDVAAVDAMFTRLGIEVVAIDMATASRAASVRARTGLKLPDAYALATAIRAGRDGDADVRMESFDRKVTKAFTSLRSALH